MSLRIWIRNAILKILSPCIGCVMFWMESLILYIREFYDLFKTAILKGVVYLGVGYEFVVAFVEGSDLLLWIVCNIKRFYKHCIVAFILAAIATVLLTIVYGVTNPVPVAKVFRRTKFQGQHYEYALRYTNQQKHTGITFRSISWQTPGKMGLPPRPNQLELFATRTADIHFVTAADSNSFELSKGAVASVQRYYSFATIFYYDLGLTEAQLEEIVRWKHVKLREIDWHIFPRHVSNLRTMAWKILLITELMLVHKAIFWFDASTRFTSADMFRAKELAIQNMGFVMFTPTGHNTLSVTDPTTLKYLPSNATALKMYEQYGSNAMLIYSTKTLFKAIHWPATLCALEPHCIAPSFWSNHFHCHPHKIHIWSMFAGCNRFDQSIYNILLNNHYNFKLERFIGRGNFFKTQEYVSEEDSRQFELELMPTTPPRPEDHGIDLEQKPNFHKGWQPVGLPPDWQDRDPDDLHEELMKKHGMDDAGESP